MLTKEKLEEFERFLEKSMFLSKDDSDDFGISKICEMKLHKKIKNETNYFEFDNLLDAIWAFDQLTDKQTSNNIENSLKNQANQLNIIIGRNVFVEIKCFTPSTPKDVE